MRKKGYVLLVLVLFFVQGVALQAVDQPPKKVVKLMKKAAKAIEKQKLEKVQKYYDAALALAPEYGPLYYAIAQFKKSQNMPAEELANLEKAMQYEPENQEYKKYVAKGLFAMAAANQKNAQQANTYYLKLTAIQGIDTLDQKLYVKSLYRIGSNYDAMKKLARAREAYLKITAISGLETTEKSIVFQTLYKLGLNFYNQQKNKESLSYFDKVIKFPDAQTESAQVYATSFYLAGLTAHAIKDYVASDKYLTQFVAMPGIPAQLIPLANFLLGSNSMSLLDKEVEAVKADKAVKKKKDKIAILAKKYSKVPQYFNRAIEKNPGIEPAYMHLGNYYYYLNDVPKTVEAYNALISKFPNSPDLAGYKRFLTEIQKKPEQKKGKKKR